MAFQKFLQRIGLQTGNDRSEWTKPNIYNLPTTFSPENLEFWENKFLLSDLRILDHFPECIARLSSPNGALPLWEKVAECSLKQTYQSALRQKNWFSVARSMDLLGFLCQDIGENEAALDWSLRAQYLWANDPDDGIARFGATNDRSSMPYFAGSGRVTRLAMSALGLDESQVKAIFLPLAGEMQSLVNAPVTPEMAWGPVRLAINKRT